MIFFLSQNILNSSGIELVKILARLDLRVGLIVGNKSEAAESPLLVSSLGSEVEWSETMVFSSVVDLALALARKFKWLPNERTLCSSIEEVAIRSGLVLARARKQLFGDSEYIASDILEVLALIKSLSLTSKPLFKDDLHLKVAEEVMQDYEKFNLINPWSLVSLLGQNRDQVWSVMKHFENALIIFGHNSWGREFCPDIPMLEVLFPEAHIKQVSVATSLNASFEGSDLFDLELSTIDGWKHLIDPWNSVGPTRRCLAGSLQYALCVAQGYVRLLVNSRDELALIHILCGPLGLINHDQFTIIRKEALRLDMPLYQVILSYVQRSRLGAQAVQKGHAFFPFHKELIALVNAVERLQTVVEENVSVEAAMSKVFSSISSRLTGKITSNVAQRFFDTLPSLVQALLKRNSRLGFIAQLDATPRHKSIMGCDNVRALRALVDLWSTQDAVNRLPDLQFLMGRMTSSHLPDSSVPASPLFVPNIWSLYKSPTAPSETSLVAPSKRPRLEICLSPTRSEAPISELAQRETAGSSIDEKCRPKQEDEPDLSAMPVATTSWKSFISKARQEADSALKEAKMGRKHFKKCEKRSILSEINNCMKSRKPSAEGSQVLGLVQLQDENSSRSDMTKKKRKPNQTKKPLPQITGQAKITKYFRL